MAPVTTRRPPGTSTGPAVFWTSISNAAVPLSALLTGPLLARTLAPAGRGQLAAVLTPLFLAPLLITFGLPESVVFHVAGRQASTRLAIRAALLLGLASGVIATIVVVASAPLVLRHFRGDIDLLVLLALTLPILMSLSLLRAIAQGQRRFELINRERWFSVASRTLLLVGLAAAGSVTVASAAVATHGTAVLAAFLLVPVISRARRSEPASRESWGQAWRLMASLARYGGRSWATTLGGIIILRLDQALIAPLAGARQLGLYAVAVSLAELPTTALLAVRDVAFATAVDRRDHEFVARTVRAVVALCIPAIIVGVALAPVVIPLAFGSDFSGSVIMAQVLFLAILPSGVGGVVLNAGLLGSGRPGLASAAQACAAAVTVAGIFLLVPSEGAIGAAFTTDAAYLVSTGLAILALTRLTGLPLRSYLLPQVSDVTGLWGLLRARLPSRAPRRSPR